MNFFNSTIAITGATGFLGRYIVRELLKRNAHVVGVVRNPNRVPELQKQGVEMRQADLSNTHSLLKAFEGVDAVISNAALFSTANHNVREHLQTNVEGTGNVFRAITTLGIRRVIHISSAAVYRRFLGMSLTPLSENFPIWPDTSRPNRWYPYPESKAMSERLALRFAEVSKLECTILRPSVIYGAFDPNFTKIFRQVTSWPIHFVPWFATLPLVYAGDVAQAVANSLERSISIGKVYNITGEAKPFREFVKAWELAGGHVSKWSIPMLLPFQQLFDHSRAQHDLDFSNRAYVDALQETFVIENQRR